MIYSITSSAVATSVGEISRPNALAVLSNYMGTVQDFKAKLQESLDITHTRVKGRSWWRGVKFKD